METNNHNYLQARREYLRYNTLREYGYKLSLTQINPVRLNATRDALLALDGPSFELIDTEAWCLSDGLGITYDDALVFLAALGRWLVANPHVFPTK